MIKIFLVLLFLFNSNLMAQCTKEEFISIISDKTTFVEDSVFKRLIRQAIQFTAQPDTCGGTYDVEIIIYYDDKSYGRLSDHVISHKIRYNYATPNIFTNQQKDWSESLTTITPCYVYSGKNLSFNPNITKFINEFDNVFLLQKFQNKKKPDNGIITTIIRRDKFKNITSVIIVEGRPYLCYEANKQYPSIIMVEFLKSFGIW